MIESYDVIVVGAGHAGCEAAAAAANMGSNTLLISMDMTKFGQMSCNPAIGGIAKGQIVREIDALGGLTGIITDKSAIQFRMLNRSKGPAMWSPRAQCDRTAFSIEWRKALEAIPNLFFWQDTVNGLIIENGLAVGVTTTIGVKFYAKAIVLTIGTFENGLIHVGRNHVPGGRVSEPASMGISESLKLAGFEVGRMKTGTPARIDGRTVDFSKLQIQESEEGKFSYLKEIKSALKTLPCYIVNTNEEVHNILRTGFQDSPLFGGIIKGRGPRYCPSIEDKIVTFAEKNSHQLFLEPEGEETNEYYLNGFSSSLPWDIQYTALRKMVGMENVKIFRPGYAIEYDYYPPTQLKSTLETKFIENLYFAGQINGTTGYEEAAGQGLMAGINAHLKACGKEPFILSRDEAYIGVLIDDLVTKGVDEPYRMFTSRAEFRILLRQDNADERLTKKGYDIGLASEKRYKDCLDKSEQKEVIMKYIAANSVLPDEVNSFLLQYGCTTVSQSVKIREIAMRSQFSLLSLFQHLNSIGKYNSSLDEQFVFEIEIALRYQGYIDREYNIANKIKKLEGIKIPANFDFERLNITIEARQKFKKYAPQTIGQASRIPGISPSDINVILIHIGR